MKLTTKLAMLAVVAMLAGTANATQSPIVLDTQPNAAIQAGGTLTVDISGLGSGHWVSLFLSANQGSTDLGPVQLGLNAPLFYLYLGYAPLGGQMSFNHNFPSIPVGLEGVSFYLQIMDCVAVEGTPVMIVSNVDSFTFAS